MSTHRRRSPGLWRRIRRRDTALALPMAAPAPAEQAWSAPRRLCVIVNPTAGQSKPGPLLDRLKGCLSPWTERLEILQTDRRGAGERLVKTLRSADFDLIVAAGGDGTI